MSSLQADISAASKLLEAKLGYMGLSQSMVFNIGCACVAIYCLSFVNTLAASICRRVGLWASGLAHMLASTDRRFNPKKQPDPDNVLGTLSNDLSCRPPTRRIIFIRHGESRWNEVFNRGFGPSILGRIAKALLQEAMCWFGTTSVFLDSPLSKLGVEQAQNLNKFLEEDPGPDYRPDAASARRALLGIDMAADGSRRGSIVVSSNLRRALETACIGLWKRLKPPADEKVHILSSLQEGSRNVDCICLADAGEAPPVQLKDALGPDAPSMPAGRAFFNAERNHGNKPVFSCGLKRMKEFAAFCMNDVPEGSTIIAAGHSLWFRNFFATFLPHENGHDAKTLKMVNGGVVAFTMMSGKVKGEWQYRIDPKSIVEVFGADGKDGNSFVRKKKKD